jgi:hypothetical protein
MTNTDKMREDFANHINDCIESEGGLMQALQRNEAGDYVTHWVAQKWVTWQAATLKAAPGWKDIADRPKDGTKYWATDGKNQFTETQPPGHAPGKWDWFEKEQYWGGCASTYKATHFMPLPAPPAPGGDK